MGRDDVLCVGSATVDHILQVNASCKDIHVGDKVLVNNILVSPGGGAVNTATTLAKFGLKVRILTKLGEDHDASLIIKELSTYNIRLAKIKRSKKPTASGYIILSAKDKDRVIYSYKGACNDLLLRDIQNFRINAGWVYLATLTGKSLKTAYAIAKKAYQQGVPLVFNPSTYMARQGKKILKPILNAARAIVLNREEAQLLLGTKTKDIRKLLEGIQDTGPDLVVITNGNNDTFALYDKEIHRVPPAPKKVIVDTAGAGDVFASTVLGAIIKGHGIREALELAAWNAASAIQEHGANRGMLTYASLLKRAHKRKSKRGKKLAIAK